MSVNIHLTSEVALLVSTLLGLSVTAVAIFRDVVGRRLGDGPVMTFDVPATMLPS